MDIRDVIEKVARQVKGSWIDAFNHLVNCGFEGLDLTEQEKEQIRSYVMLKGEVNV